MGSGLPRDHPHVIDTTHDDEAGVFLGNDLTNPNFWMYRFRTKTEVMMLIDPKHWDHILPFSDVPVDVVTTLSQAVSKLLTSWGAARSLAVSSSL